MELTRQDAIKQLEAYQKDSGSVLPNDVIDMAIKSLSDKKARYWKRRWLKQRDNIYYVINVLNNTGHTTTANFIETMIIKENRNEMDSNHSSEQ